MSERITSEAELDEIYGVPVQRALDKEVDHLPPHYRPFIERSPFVLVATGGPKGLDCSPRGDPPGFCRIVDEHTLHLPDRRGNNRVDSLRNLVHDPRISLLFLVPGVDETLRVTGTAEIVRDEELRASFELHGKLPATVIVVHIERVYHQCRKALVRSKLWDPSCHAAPGELPTPGQMRAASAKEEIDVAQVDREYPEHVKRTLY